MEKRNLLVEELTKVIEKLKGEKKLWMDRAKDMQQETLDLIKEVNSHKLDKSILKSENKELRKDKAFYSEQWEKQSKETNL